MTTDGNGNDITWKGLLNSIERRQDLSREEALWAMNEMMGGSVDPVVVAGFLVGLHTKGESAEELGAFAEKMLELARPYRGSKDAVDIVGTGGDRHNTVNVSTMAALVIAGAGATVVKHGNRASTSTTGSADSLERLGAPLDAPADRIEAAAGAVGFTFLFANTYHPAMRYIAPVRKTLGAPTAFNYLGPLANPARVRSSVIGVSNIAVTPIVADVFARRGDHALVFTGAQNLDELSLIGPSAVWETHAGETRQGTLDPSEIDLPGNTLADITGRDAEYNAEVIRRVLAGEKGPVRDTVLLNAAAGLVVREDLTDRPLAERLNEAIHRAAVSIDTGAAQSVLTRWIDYLRSEASHSV